MERMHYIGAGTSSSVGNVDPFSIELTQLDVLDSSGEKKPDDKLSEIADQVASSKQLLLEDANVMRRLLHLDRLSQPIKNDEDEDISIKSMLGQLRRMAKVYAKTSPSKGAYGRRGDDSDDDDDTLTTRKSANDLNDDDDEDEIRKPKKPTKNTDLEDGGDEEEEEDDELPNEDDEFVSFVFYHFKLNKSKHLIYSFCLHYFPSGE